MCEGKIGALQSASPGPKLRTTKAAQATHITRLPPYTCHARNATVTLSSATARHGTMARAVQRAILQAAEESGAYGR